MRLMICNVDENPCQVVNQATMAFSDALDPSMYGITPEGIAHVYAWGFGAILLAFLIGYGVAVAVGVIRKV